MQTKQLYSCGTKYEEMDQKSFLKAVFHKFYFIHPLILCHIFRTVKGNSLRPDSQLALETSIYFALISWGRFQTWKCLWILKKCYIIQISKLVAFDKISLHWQKRQQFIQSENLIWKGWLNSVNMKILSEK